MTKIRVTKEFTFEMSHALEGYDGQCRHIHGHSYKLFVTAIGTPNTDKTSPKLGMVMDFGDMKKVVNELIIRRFDHALLLRQTADNAELFGRIQEYFGKVELTDYQPTCENMIVLFAEILGSHLPLHHLRLHETATSYAEWYSSDNK